MFFKYSDTGCIVSFESRDSLGEILLNHFLAHDLEGAQLRLSAEPEPVLVD